MRKDTARPEAGRRETRKVNERRCNRATGCCVRTHRVRSRLTGARSMPLVMCGIKHLQSCYIQYSFSHTSKAKTQYYRKTIVTVNTCVAKNTNPTNQWLSVVFRVRSVEVVVLVGG